MTTHSSAFRATRVALTVWLCAVTALVAGQVTGGRAPIAFRDVTVIDPASGRVIPHAIVVVSNATIDAVDLDGGTVPPQAQVLDASGLFLLPGLWDMHTHVNDDGAWAFPLTVAAGVVGIRDMGAALATVDDWRIRQRRGDVMPELRVSGPLLTGPMDDDDPRMWRLRTAGDAASALDRLRAANVDHIKVHDWLPAQAWRAILDGSRRAGVPVVGHVPIEVDAVEAADEGQRSIEHFGNAWGGLLLDVSTDESPLKQELRERWRRVAGPRELAQLMTAERWDRIVRSYSNEKARALAERLHARGTFVCPTMYSFAWLGQTHIGPSFGHDARLEFLPEARRAMLKEMVTDADVRSPQERERARRVYDAQARLLRTFVEYDVPILAGTDYEQSPLLFPGASLHDELRTLVGAGLSPLTAIRAATSEVGRYLRDDRVGCLKPGCAANLLLVDGNPLDRIENISKVRAIVLRGDYIPAERRALLLDAARQPK